MDINEHNCENLTEILDKSKVNGISVINIIISRYEDHSWYLTKSYYADEQTVFDGEADKIGEETSKFSTIVNYCPYCGIKL